MKELGGGFVVVGTIAGIVAGVNGLTWWWLIGFTVAWVLASAVFGARRAVTDELILQNPEVIPKLMSDPKGAKMVRDAIKRRKG